MNLRNDLSKDRILATIYVTATRSDRAPSGTVRAAHSLRYETIGCHALVCGNVTRPTSIHGRMHTRIAQSVEF